MLIRLGTRQSPLALWQADFVSKGLRAAGHDVELVKITTSGDTSTTPLEQSGGVGVFTKEIQRALLDGRCDLAVHSLKDLPTEPTPQLRLAAVPPREDPADCLLSRTGSFEQLPLGASLGTGSPRRRAQLLRLRPDLKVLDIRGNVDTRIRKLDEGQFDAIVLAYAGLHRLGLAARITHKFTLQELLPAVGQAALGLETRTDDSSTIEAVSVLNDPNTHAAVLAERTLLRSLRAGCLAPLAAHATVSPSSIHLMVRVFSQDGSQLISGEHHLPYSDDGMRMRCAEELGQRVAQQLTDRGADHLIQKAHT